MYVYRDKKQELNDEEFMQFINEKYELFQEKDLMDNAFYDINNYEKKILEIKQEYVKKVRMVSVENILIQELDKK